MFGYIPDVPDSTDQSAENILEGISDAKTGSISWSVVSILRQIGNSCTVHAVNQAGRCLARINGDPNPPLWNLSIPYWDGRSTPRTDNGAMPRKIFTAYYLYGYCLESAWPISKESLSKAPPPRVRSQSYPQAGKLGYYRCSDNDANQRVKQIRRALSGSFPVVAGFTLDAAFVNYQGGLWSKTGPSVGRHYMLIVAFDGEGVLVCNSWGEDWGVTDENGLHRGGFAWISWKMLRDLSICTDVYVLTREQAVVTKESA